MWEEDVEDELDDEGEDRKAEIEQATAQVAARGNGDEPADGGREATVLVEVHLGSFVCAEPAVEESHQGFSGNDDHVVAMLIQSTVDFESKLTGVETCVDASHSTFTFILRRAGAECFEDGVRQYFTHA